MLKPKLLLGCNFSDRFNRLLSMHYTIAGPFEVSRIDELLSASVDARALITKAGLASNQEIIDVCPSLELVACFGTGYEGIDLARALERNLIVTHSPGANASSVADFAIGLILASTRQILAADRFVREGHWVDSGVVNMPAVPGLRGAKLGIFGLGAVGKKVASRAVAFDMEVGYHGRSPKDGVPYLFLPTLEALADWADVLVIAARADGNNRHIINQDIMRRVGTSGHIINIARGSLVDQMALVEALEKKTLAGAALDVFENEPNLPERLLKAPNLVLSPHLAYATIDARNAQEDMVLANLEAHFHGLPAPNRVPFVSD
ncbi:2-hydroxyacid dehydrogenase [Rhizobium sp. ZX09]|uniref:2-hydroxyacid dehydrogenase n=1 Tax=Rhizobium sp. ZX09 TaxID=2291939 RepID=UPI001A9892D6|nr:2-hydroxyacid dehydrogenase [Rhizobium sp. ZX09]QSZ59367.1 2-hydroxyacid dehydrogenase [Rhizobium sp. ZX09]